MRALSLLQLALMACSVAGPPPESHDASLGHDGQPRDAPPLTGDDAAALDAPGTVDAGLACKPANIIHGDGKHNPSQNCMDGCHNHGFSVAGTLYLADNVTPAVNATVTVVDAGHNSQDIIVSTNGNFFSYLPVQYPITVSASLCPDTQLMVGTATAGGCNANGCHEPGGVQGFAHL